MIYTYGLTIEELMDIPTLDPSSIGPRTSPISTKHLTRWLEEGCGYLNGALRKSGITPSETMDPDAHGRNRAAVRAYVRWQALETLGVTGPQYDNAKSTWTDSYQEVSDRPQQVGGYTDSVRTELDVAPPPPSWDFKGFSRNNW